jgi:non-canonical (house-cleaning) NTP pyrophosphatase
MTRRPVVHIAVGSGNPVKRDAVVRVFPAATVEAVRVDSGVNEQPTNPAETRHGAATRARRAYETTSAGLGIGIEGGIATVPRGRDETASGPSHGAGDGPTVPRAVGDDLPLFLVMWAAVTDGDLLSHGGGPTLPLPRRIADRVRDGEELGPVMDDVLGVDDVAKKQGAAGVFTAGRLTRTDALEAAVAAAAGPFLSDQYRDDR